MSDNGIEDILIGQNPKKEKKKGRGIVIFIILLLLCALAALIGIYYRLTHNEVPQKDQFMTAASKIDYKNVTNKTLLDNVVKRFVTTNSESETEISFSTTVKNEELKDIDVSKFLLKLDGSNDAENRKSYNEMNINYSGNKVYGLKMLLDENKAALFAEEVTDKYVALKYDSMPNILGLNVTKSYVDNFIELNMIDIAEDEFKMAVGKYANKFVENIPDTNFSKKENMALPKSSSTTIDVTGYSLKLSQEELKTSLIAVLEELKNDDNLINKFITGKSSSHVIQTTPEGNPEIQLNTNVVVPEQPVQDDGVTENQPVENNEGEQNPVEVSLAEPVDDTTSVEPATDVEFQTEQVVETENVEVTENATEEVQEEPVEQPVEQTEVPQVIIEPITDEQEEIVESEENVLEEINKNDYSSFIYELLLGYKIDMSIAEVKELIDDMIEYIKTSEGEGLEIILYLGESEVEKITIKLPNTNTIDIEFIMTSVQETNVKLTYLYKGSNSGLEFIFGDKEKIAENDTVIITEPVDDNQINGYSIEMLKNNRDASIAIKCTLSIIENEEINEKYVINLETEGTSNSKLVKNTLGITHSTEDGETNINADNKIKFSTNPSVDSLNQENSIFLDELPEEQIKQTVEDIKTKLKAVYESKQANLNFIDTNTNSSIIDSNIFDQVTQLSRDDARNLIVQGVSAMMQDAIDNNREFTIRDIKDLKIEGQVVGVSVTDTNATIVIGMYTFNIDANFNLTDVE